RARRRTEDAARAGACGRLALRRPGGDACRARRPGRRAVRDRELKGATMVQADPLRSRSFAPSALRMTGQLAPRREMMKPTRREGSVAFALGPLASGRVQLGVHESTLPREAHGRVAPRFVEMRLRSVRIFAWGR